MAHFQAGEGFVKRDDMIIGVILFTVSSHGQKKKIVLKMYLIGLYLAAQMTEHPDHFSSKKNPPLA